MTTNKTYKFTISNLRQIKQLLFWDYYYTKLHQPKVKSPVPHDDYRAQEEIIRELRKNSFILSDYYINVADYKQYMNNAEYYGFSDYYGAGKENKFIEKTLEHYLAAKFLDFSKDDVYIDIASENSPVTEIYHKLYGCKTYRQDLAFPKGLNGNVIGGEASNMPIEDWVCYKNGTTLFF